MAINDCEADLDRVRGPVTERFTVMGDGRVVEGMTFSPQPVDDEWSLRDAWKGLRSRFTGFVFSGGPKDDGPAQGM